MMIRVRDLPVPATGRGDVPSSLERLLRQAMSKEPRQRPATAEDLARALNAIEEELRLRPTPFKVARQSNRVIPVPVSGPPADSTRIRAQPVVVAPSEAKSSSRSSSRRSPQQLPPGGANTPETSEDVDQETEDTHHVGRNIVISVVVTIVIAAGVVGWIILGPPGQATPTNTALPTPVVTQDDPIPNAIPGLPQISASLNATNDGVTFRWTYANAARGDYYLVSSPAISEAVVRVDEREYTLPYAGEPVCLTVRVSRENGGMAQPDGTEKCYPS